MKISISIFIYLFVFGCAGQRPPGGGPPDLIPPEIIYTYPENLFTNFNSNKIIVEFSENVDKRSVVESIYITPTIKNIEYDWNGNILTMFLNDKLQSNTTYVLNIGTDVVDLNNNNRLAQTFTLAVSTGSKIDNGQINGKVFSNNPSGVMIYAYKNVNINKINLSKDEPSYITQTGKNGEYNLLHLASGSYNIFALKDEFRNILYDTEIDELGISNQQININSKDTIYEKINFKLFKDDIIKPRLINVEMIDENHLKLKFNEEIDSNSLSKIALFYNVNNEITKYNSALLNSKNELLIIGEFKSDLKEIKIENLFDLANNKIDEKLNSKNVVFVSQKDTTSPKIIYSNIENNKLYKSVINVQLQFDDEINYVQNSFVLTSENGENIETNINNLSKSKVEIIPKTNLLGGKYYLKIFTRSISNKNNISGGDSIKFINFEIVSSLRYGSIKGIMKRIDLKNSDMNIHLKNISFPDIEFISKLNQSNEFEIQNIMEGDYILSYFEDENKNSIWDKGSLNPFKYSEKYFEYPDKIKIRARWPLEGIILQ